jgi:hypothetical protein
VNRKSIALILWISLFWLKGWSQEKETLEVLSSIAENHKFLLHSATLSHVYLKKYHINLEDLNFWNPCKHKFEEDNTFLVKEEWEVLNSEFHKLKKQKLPKSILKRSNQSDSTKYETTYITWPILFRDNSYAVYYSEQRYGGEINLLKKENGKWKEYCYYMVWIE